MRDYIIPFESINGHQPIQAVVTAVQQHVYINRGEFAYYLLAWGQA